MWPPAQSHPYVLVKYTVGLILFCCYYNLHSCENTFQENLDCDCEDLCPKEQIGEVGQFCQIQKLDMQPVFQFTPESVQWGWDEGSVQICASIDMLKHFWARLLSFSKGESLMHTKTLCHMGVMVGYPHNFGHIVYNATGVWIRMLQTSFQTTWLTRKHYLRFFFYSFVCLLCKYSTGFHIAII